MNERSTVETRPLLDRRVTGRASGVELGPLFCFLAVAFGLAWALFLLPLALGLPDGQTRQTATLIAWSLAMWAPGIGALVATRFVAREPLRTLALGRLGPRRAYLFAWALPTVAAITVGILTALLGAGHLDLEFTVIRDALAQAPGGEAMAPAVLVAIQIAFAFTLAPLINTIPALGEELGWRGFLLPRLLPVGQMRAILLSGVIWGIWHAPVILQGHNYPTQPVLGVFLMIVFCVLSGTILSWLYLWTRSPWAPALCHGAINATAGLSLLFVRDVDPVLGGTTASLIGWIPLAAIVAWLILTHRLPVLETEADTSVVAREARIAAA